MKKLIASFTVLVLLVLLVPTGMAQYVPGEKRKFLVTAYYSPLPGQDFYIRGNYEADIRLNGRGTNGADGTEVFTGMLAAPKTYSFGTRIRIPGLGVGEVHDRGGAIIARADYDRIDVWMGRGEEGLGRAVNWGARMVEGEVWTNPHQAEPGLSFSSISPRLSDAFIARLKQQASYVTTAPVIPVAEPVPVKTPEELAREIEVEREQSRLRETEVRLAAGMGKNATGEEVGALQQMLWELGYYHGPISKTYDEMTIDAVFDFQQEHGILSAAYEVGAGYYGKQTHEVLIASVDQRIEKIKEYPKEMQTWIPVERELPKLEDLSPVTEMVPIPTLNFDIALTSEPYEFTLNLRPGDKGDDVIAIQDVLIREGYLESGLNTGYFGNQTRSAIVQFQLKNDLITLANEPGAGRVGPMTREVLNTL